MEYKIQKWKLLESEYLIKRPWLTARRDKVELPDGTIHPEYYILEYPDWVKCNRRNYRRPLCACRTIPPWHRRGIDRTLCRMRRRGRSPGRRSQRELLEETGFGGGEWELIATVSPNSRPRRTVAIALLHMALSRSTKSNTSTRPRTLPCTL